MTVLPGCGAGDGLTVVVEVRAMTHVPAPQGTFISGPDCTEMLLAPDDGSIVPLICSVCPTAMPLNMHPTTRIHMNIIDFIL
jgi:hypothetical protein